ncbi:MAG TPA: MFS transporter [Mycobacteriales bacterium]|jgi:MFS family permease|nr:MFS transporter [Mycobacteriales bacterium]
MMPDPRAASLRRRLRPLHAAVFLQGFLLWLPVEKLFITTIGFDAAAVGLLAAVYAAVVPVLQLPAGILADRWSRRGVLIVSSLALAASSLLGGLSHSIGMYLVAALALGVFFAFSASTLESVVYDTVLEETGTGEGFERRIGRVRTVEAVALVSSSLLGGWVADLLDPRITYFLTIPFAAASIAGYAWFREPRLHRAAAPVSLRRHLAITVTAITRRGRLVPVVTLAVLVAVLAQLLFEFGPLWLVALAVPAAVYGPYWAALVSTVGLSGLLAGRVRLDRPATAWGIGAAMTVAALTLTTGAGFLVITAAQITLALLVGLAEIHVSAVLHDAVPSAIRSGVASGVSSLSWLVFLPVALGFGALSNAHGVSVAGWMFVVITVAAAGLVVATAYGPAPVPAAWPDSVPAPAPAPVTTSVAVPGEAMECVGCG